LIQETGLVFRVSGMRISYTDISIYIVITDNNCHGV